jgi:hypothetical protein
MNNMRLIKNVPVVLIWVFFVIGCKEGKPGKKSDVPELSTTKFQLSEKRMGNSNYYVSIPNDYVMNENKGPDFYVYYFYPLDTTVKAPFSGGFYFGNFPHEFEPENVSCKLQEIKGKFLDSIANWKIHDCVGKYFIQTIVETKGAKGGNGKIHAFGNARTKDWLKMVLEIFGTMKSKK